MDMPERRKLSRGLYLLLLCLAPFLLSNPLFAQKALSSQYLKVPSSAPTGSWKNFSLDRLKLFINDIFLTAQEVNPEMRAEGLRQLGGVIETLDSNRALWVLNQAFYAAQAISLTDQVGMRSRLQSQIITQESRLDLAQAVNHALSMSTPDTAPDSESTAADEKLRVMADLARLIPADDTEGLFQKIAPALVREDSHFDQTHALVHIFQKGFPDRAQYLFTEALLQFNVRPPDELLLRVFSSLTSSVAANNPALVQTAIEVLLKKADALDAKQQSEDSPVLGIQPSAKDTWGPLHLLIVGQFLPLMQRMNPSLSSEWQAAFKDRRNIQRWNRTNSQWNARVDIQPSSPRDRTADSPRPGMNEPTRRPNVRAPGSVTPGASIQRRPDPALIKPGQSSEDEESPIISFQPPPPFSLTLTTSIAKAQTSARLDASEFSRQLQPVLRQVYSEGDPRIQAAAFSQIALVFFQMGDSALGQKYLQESLARAQQGDASLLQNAYSPRAFFSLYSASSNSVTRVAPLFPQEVIQSLGNIMDAQLRFRAMIDTVRVLGIVRSSTTLR